jgi:hypothetical protein
MATITEKTLDELINLGLFLEILRLPDLFSIDFFVRVKKIQEERPCAQTE